MPQGWILDLRLRALRASWVVLSKGLLLCRRLARATTGLRLILDCRRSNGQIYRARE